MTRSGPLGAKAQGECAINAVTPAIANAVANATGVRFPDLPLTPDRIFEKLTPTAARGGTEFYASNGLNDWVGCGEFATTYTELGSSGVRVLITEV